LGLQSGRAQIIEERLMKRLLLALLVVAACAVGLAFYLGWVAVTSDSANGTFNITFMVNRDKLREDEKKALEKVHGIGQTAKE
jgi:hypothetical protein